MLLLDAPWPHPASMRNKRASAWAGPFLLVFWLLAPLSSSGTPPSAPPLSAEPVPATDEDSGFRPRLALELGLLWLPSPGGPERFARLLPALGLDGGEHFALTLGAPLHLRLLDDAPQGPGALLRREDWDEPSDFGQLVRELLWRSEAGHFSLRAGPLALATLGHGHLVSRYSNQLAPDYHPAGAVLSVSEGPVQVQALVSDVLAARLFAGQVGLALDPEGRYRVSLAAAHDAGRAGGHTPALTLAQAGADAVLSSSERLRVVALTSAGARVDGAVPGWGALVGVAVTGRTSALAVHSRWEVRRHGEGFRFGLFGADHELARFASTGQAGVPQAQARLPSAFSALAEVSVAHGAPLDSLHLSASVCVEHFSFGRTDADLALHLALPGGGTSFTARLTATGPGTEPRVSARGELIQRLVSGTYAWGSFALLHLPRAEGLLERGWSAGGGVGYGR